MPLRRRKPVVCRGFVTPRVGLEPTTLRLTARPTGVTQSALGSTEPCEVTPDARRSPQVGRKSGRTFAAWGERATPSPGPCRAARGYTGKATIHGSRQPTTHVQVGFANCGIIWRARTFRVSRSTCAEVRYGEAERCAIQLGAQGRTCLQWACVGSLDWWSSSPWSRSWSTSLSQVAGAEAVTKFGWSQARRG
jgi:hypothetical protein